MAPRGLFLAFFDPPGLEKGGYPRRNPSWDDSGTPKTARLYRITSGGRFSGGASCQAPTWLLRPPKIGFPDVIPYERGPDWGPESAGKGGVLTVYFRPRGRKYTVRRSAYAITS